MKQRFMAHAPDANPVVGQNAFRRPPPPRSEFQRRAAENAEYRAHVGDAKAVRAQHAHEHQVAAPAKPERPPEPRDARFPALHGHWVTVLRLIARIKRRFQ